MQTALCIVAAAVLVAALAWWGIGFVLRDDPDEERWDRFETNSRRDDLRQAAKERI